MDNKLLWSKVLDTVSSIINPFSFRTWFEPVKLFEIRDNTAVISVPVVLYKHHLEQNYNTVIIDVLNNVGNLNIEKIEYILDEEAEKLKKDNDEVLNIEKEIVEDNDLLENHNSNLNKNYTFDTFVVGESNKFAQAAALAVAENPGTIYNPLFIYGNSGLGKTHLMHAIGNYIEENHKLKVLYVTSDDFMNDYTGISRRGSDYNNLDYVEFFKNKYRNIDVLIIDDIQFLGAGEKTQQEFFHTFNNLHSNSKQIIVSSDRSPKDLKVLEDRLRTRFTMGLQVDISPPDYELKKAIVKMKIKGEEINLSDEIISFIASSIGNDVRQLEGSVNRLVAYSAIMSKTEIDIPFAKEALKDFIRNEPVVEQDDIRKIQKSVAYFYKISFEDMKSKKRNPSLVIPRQVAMYLCKKLTNETLERIGLEFSGKSHATVIHSYNKIAREIKINEDLKNAIDNIEKELT